MPEFVTQRLFFESVAKSRFTIAAVVRHVPTGEVRLFVPSRASIVRSRKLNVAEVTWLGDMLADFREHSLDTSTLHDYVSEVIEQLGNPTTLENEVPLVATEWTEASAEALGDATDGKG